MSGLSIWGREQMMKAFFIPEQFTCPSDLYMALTVSAPMAGESGAEIEEPDDAVDYARQPYGLGEAYWTMTGRGTVENVAEMLFGPALTTDWGLIVGWALCTAPTGGDVVLLGEMASPYYVIHGPQSELRVGAGMLSLAQI